MTKENEMKKMTAHFWNLNEDPQLTNMVSHFLQPGKIFLLGYDDRDYQPYLTTTLPGSVGMSGFEHGRLRCKSLIETFT